MPAHRRSFLAAAAAGLLGLRSHVAAADSPPAIDTHTHFYDPRRPAGVPWPGKGDKVLYRPVLPDEFEEVTKKFNVRSTIVVEASPRLEDNQWLLDLAARHPFVTGVVGNLDPASAECAKNFARFSRDPVFRGIRINHADLRKGLENQSYLANLALLEKGDCALDVNGGPDMPSDVARLAQRLPNLRVLINHMGNVRIDGKEPPAEWRKNIQAAAQAKNVFCKVSALVEGTGRQERDAPSEVAFYRPVLDVVWNAFGKERLLYGSNWPVSERAAPYGRLHEIVRSYFESKGLDVAEKFFAGNAIVAYKPARKTGSPKR